MFVSRTSSVLLPFQKLLLCFLYPCASFFVLLLLWWGRKAVQGGGSSGAHFMNGRGQVAEEEGEVETAFKGKAH
jgi:hypothetical protein